MKFAMSYSCGKDSTLALHKMQEEASISCPSSFFYCFHYIAFVKLV